MQDLIQGTAQAQKHAADAYMALDALIRESTRDVDDPRHSEIVIEGENLMETFEAFIGTLKGEING